MLSAEPGGEPVPADRPQLVGGLIVDEQVRVGGVGPAGSAVVEPFQQQTVGEFVEWSDVGCDGKAPVAEVDVVELQGSGGGGPGGVDGGQGDYQPIGWTRGVVDGSLYLIRAEGLDKLRARSPTRIRLVGLVKTTRVFLQ